MKTKKMLIIPAIFALLLVSSIAFASASFSIQPVGGPVVLGSSQISEISQINQAIIANGAGWTAAENPISSLSPEQRKKMLGINKSLIEQQEVPNAVPDAGFSIMESALPSAFDWRNKDGKNWITGVKDQGMCGSCWAFAAVGAIEAELNINSNNPNFNSDLSEQQLISCCPSCGSCNGGSSSGAFDFANNTGLAKENWFRYDASNRQCNLSNYWQDTVKKITGWHYIGTWNNISLNHLKNEIINEGPVVIYFDVYDDFFYYSGGIYRHLWGNMAEGHAMLLVGYNDEERYLIIKNSWGGWGEGGYIRHSYDALPLIWGAMVISGTDRDADGVQDKTDNCPDVYNPDQKDSDKDGIGDICDNCPSIYNSDQNDSNKNGCGDVCDSGICAKQELCSRIINLIDFNIVPAKIIAEASCPGKLFDNYDTDEKNLYIDHPQLLTIITDANIFVTSDHWVDPIFSRGSYKDAEGNNFVYKEVNIGYYTVGAKASCGPWMGGEASTEADYEKKKYYTFNETVYTAEECQNSDSDNDGFLNKYDKCPYAPGPSSNSGCPVCSDTVCAKFALLEDFENVSDWDNEWGHLNSFYKSNDAAFGNYSMTLSSSAKCGCWTGKVRKTFTLAISLNNYSSISFYAKKGNSTYGSYSPSLAITLIDSQGSQYIYGNYARCGGITINSTQWQKYTFDLPTTTSNISRINIDLYSAGWGSTSPADILIDQLELNQNLPPVLNPIANKTIEAMQQLSFKISATDPNGDSLTYSAQNLPAGATFSNQQFSWTPAKNQTGSYQITFIASDGKTSVAQTIKVNVDKSPIICSSNSDCGTNGWIGNPFCSNTNVLQNYRTYSCLNSGAITSSCSYSDSNQTKQTCLYGCSNGQCLVQSCSDECSASQKQCSGDGFQTCGNYDSDSCLEWSPVSACAGNQLCQNGNCINQSIACSSNSDCGTNGFTGSPFCSNGNVMQNYRTYSCLNPGTITSSCTHSDSNQTNQTCQYGCSNGNCIIYKSHDHKDCYISDIYWFDSCGNREDVVQYCETSPVPGITFCDGSSVYQYYAPRGCANGFCVTFNGYNTVKKEDCSNGCENGACKPPAPKPDGECNIPGGCVKKQREGPVNSASCSDGIDNDGNGLIDDDDPGCQ